jgi:hypothetical protein
MKPTRLEHLTGAPPSRRAQRSTIRRILREYFEARLEAAQPGKVELIASRLCMPSLGRGRRGVQSQPSSVLAGLFIESLNEVMDLHTKRVQGTRILGSSGQCLYFVTYFAMTGIGYHEGLTTLQRSPALVIVVFAFSAVIYLIADLRPTSGRSV